MSDQITYDDKADLIVDTTIDDMFKVSASDMNEIKNVVNANASALDDTNTNIGELANLTTTDKTSIVNAINELETDKLETSAVVNEASTETDEVYSSNYLNDKLVAVGTTAPTDGRRVWFEKSVNLFDKSKVVLGKVWNSGSNTKRAYGYIEAIQGQQYTASIENTNSDLAVYIVETLTIGTTTNPVKQTALTNTLTFIPQSTTKYIVFQFATTNNDITQSDIDNAKPQLQLGSTATTYEPYVEKSINVDDELWYKKGGFVDISDTQPTNNASLWVQPTTENLLDYRNFQTKTSNGINIVNNHDGTFIVNGTASGDVSEVVSDVFIPMSGTWRMLGCPSGGSSSTYMLSAYVGYWGGGSPNIDTGSGTNITYTGNVKVRFYIKNGTTCNNLVFKPMLTTNTSATINDFVPKGPNIYALINGQYQIV